MSYEVTVEIVARCLRSKSILARVLVVSLFSDFSQADHPVLPSGNT